MAAHRLRDLRLASGMTQKAVAARIGVAPVQVRRWEHEREEIEDRHVEELARLFGVSVPFLLNAERRMERGDWGGAIASLENAVIVAAKPLGISEHELIQWVKRAKAVA